MHFFPLLWLAALLPLALGQLLPLALTKRQSSSDAYLTDLFSAITPQCSSVCNVFLDTIGNCVMDGMTDDQIVDCSCSDKVFSTVKACADCIAAGTGNRAPVNNYNGFVAQCKEIYDDEIPLASTTAAARPASSSARSPSTGTASVAPGSSARASTSVASSLRSTTAPSSTPRATSTAVSALSAVVSTSRSSAAAVSTTAIASVAPVPAATIRNGAVTMQVGWALGVVVGGALLW